MAIKVAVEWRVFNKSTNERVEGVSQTSMVNSYEDIQPKIIDKISQNYNAKDLEKDMKIQNKLSPTGNRGGYFINETVDDSKEHDIVIIVEVLNH